MFCFFFFFFCMEQFIVSEINVSSNLGSPVNRPWWAHLVTVLWSAHLQNPMSSQLNDINNEEEEECHNDGSASPRHHFRPSRSELEEKVRLFFSEAQIILCCINTLLHEAREVIMHCSMLLLPGLLWNEEPSPVGSGFIALW
uniref:Putative secreted protein n=1 Tax=Rhipicephalus microplus TaxID=6941 RepID=A0A6M2DBH3_RHIMP